jgi:hypothetical protein
MGCSLEYEEELYGKCRGANSKACREKKPTWNA